MTTKTIKQENTESVNIFQDELQKQELTKKKEKTISVKKPKAPKKEIVVITQEEVNAAIEKNPDMKWFILQTYSGKDAAALRSIQERLKTSETEKDVGIIILAEKKVSSLRNNKLSVRKQILYPGYLWVLAKVEQENGVFMDEKVYFAINGSANLNGFTGQGNDQLPKAIRSSVEIRKMVSQLQKKDQDAECQLSYKVGSNVKVLSDTFVGMIGTVSAINNSNVSVKLVMLGSDVNIDFEFNEIEETK